MNQIFFKKSFQLDLVAAYSDILTMVKTIFTFHSKDLRDHEFNLGNGLIA